MIGGSSVGRLLPSRHLLSCIWFCLGFEPYGVFPFNVNMSIGIDFVQVLVRHP